jgi:hypothetical protein
VAGQISNAELNRLERIEFEADWNEAKERLGVDPIAGDLRRTHAQRKADAFRIMAERSATLPEDGRCATYAFTVIVGEAPFGWVCRLASGQSATPAQLAPYLNDQAVVRTIVYDRQFRPIKGSSARYFRGLLAIAIKAKHRRCAHGHCDTPVDRTAIDHKLAASRGGPTSDENGQPYCDPHNGRKGAGDDPWLPDDFTDP